MQKLRTILIISICILLLSGCQKSPLDRKHITDISLTPSLFLRASSVTYTREEKSSSLEDLATLLENFYTEPVLEEHIVTSDFALVIHYKDDSSRFFQLDLDTGLQKAYLTEEDKTYILSGNDYTQLVDSPLFANYMAVKHQAPKVQFTLDNTLLGLSGQSTFSYLGFNGVLEGEAADFIGDTPQPIQLNTSLNPSFTFEADHQPSEVVESLYKGDALIETTTIENHQLLLPTEEGDFTIQLDFKWDNLSTDFYKGDTQYTVHFHNDLPVVFNVTEPTAVLGDCFVVTAKNVNPDQTLTFTAPFYDRAPVVFYPYEDLMIGIMPVHPSVAPDTYSLTATVTNEDGSTQSTEFPVEVLYKKFDTQYLTVTEETLSLQSQENIDSDTALLAKARSNSTPEKLWEGPFIRPVGGVVTTEFSETRYTNDNPVPSRHSGIDLAVPLGTPVQASNNGIVTMAKTLYLTGNTVVVDHGMGIFTAYCHLDSMDVAEGDAVKKGDSVGKVGTTGFSTGPHLHFTFYLNGTYVNPWTFFEKDYLDF